MKQMLLTLLAALTLSTSCSSYSKNEDLTTSKEETIATVYVSQFCSLYSFGDCPTCCLKSLVKCCGYLKPIS